jgi:hypothetical protein
MGWYLSPIILYNPGRRVHIARFPLNRRDSPAHFLLVDRLFGQIMLLPACVCRG